MKYTKIARLYVGALVVDAVSGPGVSAGALAPAAAFLPFVVLLPGGRPRRRFAGCASATASTVAPRFSPAIRISFRYLRAPRQSS